LKLFILKVEVAREVGIWAGSRKWETEMGTVTGHRKSQGY
jgi:hypothetical protein